MNRTVFGVIFGVLLLGAVFFYASLQLRLRHARQTDPDVRVIRFAHPYLDQQMKRALDEAAARYEASQRAAGRRVIVEQIPVPARMYAAWARTQFVGGTAPDLIVISPRLLISDELTVRYLLPMRGAVDEPNPHNVGTPLEGRPWRRTFVDGLEVTGFNPSLMDVYAVPLATSTVRLFYNRSLLRALTGREEIPGDLEEFLDLCREVSGRQGRAGTVFPMAGSGHHAEIFLEYYFGLHTQRLRAEIDLAGELYADVLELNTSYLRGLWSLDHPAVRQGLATVRALALNMQPGFERMGREDALFLFLQERALMLPTSSWEATTILEQARFEVGVATYPLPDFASPQNVRFMNGRPSEAGHFEYGGVALSAASRDPDAALDFLRFLTSHAEAGSLASMSGTLPAVEGVEPKGLLRAFTPYLDGYMQGFTLRSLGPNTRGRFNRTMHSLYEPRGSVERFLEAIQPGYEAAVRDDLRSWARLARQTVMWQDSLLAANRALAEGVDARGEAARAGRRLHSLLDTQTLRESLDVWVWHELSAGPERISDR